MPYRKTTELVRQLGITHNQIAYLIRENRLQPPLKDASGDYLWSDDDVERLRAALAKLRSRRRATASAPVEEVAHAAQ